MQAQGLPLLSSAGPGQRGLELGHGGRRLFQVSRLQLQLQLALVLVEQISIKLRPITFGVHRGDFPALGFGDLCEQSGLSPA